MGTVRNILFIMCDQLRYDYLGCTGHPGIRTPHIDALAKRGVNFSHTFVQAPVCGSSRMSFYTGRYVFSHGATYNGVPLNIGEQTLGDHLRRAGITTGLIGKTHMAPDRDNMGRLGISPTSNEGVLASQCGFEPWERDDGLHPDELTDPNLAYNRFLREQGYEGDNPWHTAANSGRDADGTLQSGWFLRNAHLAAEVKAEHSETAYMTNRAMEKVSDLGDQPWCLHLSYIKPHWPYMAPAPYHAMYGKQDILPANRTDAEKAAPHPVVQAFMAHEESRNFSDEAKRRHVIPAYMGLISEIDDNIGRLMAFLDQQGRLDDTLIVFTSDHGDYLGDHWLGEKELFHEESVRIPLIVVDPSAAADATRGTTDPRLVEAIDLVPTFTDYANLPDQPHLLEGRSLRPLIQGEDVPIWRSAVFSEVDYAWRGARLSLGLQPDQTRAYMVRSDQWKYISFDGFMPQLFDLQADPHEQQDLGVDPAYGTIREAFEAELSRWIRARKTRITVSHEQIEQKTDNARDRGIYFGVW
ncbi:alkaline phosphatase family protein [Sneathiella chinensis]|uniref:Phosphonate monoester hydrolase n=1 Tax=Sneathiella chinensis TaxID=349750 RepID=A0ABQ5U478_9PROT|nr:alkaline phosphatase family protein [Sneathiella chinensis]GLQ06949.1 phosphonate monoester hydrolase [Sneathiella chinensis]